MRRRAKREKSGISMVEFVAALVIGLPPIVAMLYATIEANMLFTIRTNLDIAVRRASQALINDYAANLTPAQPAGGNTNLPSNLAFDIPTADGHYFVRRTANQFTWTWDLLVLPHTVTVTATYPTTGSQSNGLLPFPYPDPLKLANKFNITATGTFPVPNPI